MRNEDVSYSFREAFQFSLKKEILIKKKGAENGRSTGVGKEEIIFLGIKEKLFQAFRVLWEVHKHCNITQTLVIDVFDNAQTLISVKLEREEYESKQ